MSLPIYNLEPDLLAALRDHRRIILEAPTGSGKSTQVPQMLLRHGWLDRGEAVVLQPRRLPARLLAKRVAEEVGCPLGDTVGYQIRFENHTGASTRIRYVTEGILLRRMIQDPFLNGVQVLVFDEFHERHLYGDITLARALDLQAADRPDLILLVMSATLDTAPLQRYLDPCALLTSEGRTYPVGMRYLPKPLGDREPVWDAAADALAAAMREGAEGDALVFMPGSYEINRTLQALELRRETSGCLALPLHGELTAQAQDAAVSRYDRRKIVVATNVAETSLTIDGIRIVVDSGLARIPDYDPHRGINTLHIRRISRASADQRAGRAGRTAPGLCLRLWTERDHAQRPLQEPPEIKRLDLAEVLLTLKAAEVTDPRAFRWFDPPDEPSLARALLLLRDLGAIETDDGPLTDLGRRMLAFPMHPRYARMLIAAGEAGCVPQAALIAALTQGRDLLIRNPGKAVGQAREDLFGEQADSDFFILMRAWSYAKAKNYAMPACRALGIHAGNARQTTTLHEQFLRLAKAEGLPVEPTHRSDDDVMRCILAGFSDHLARRIDRGSLRCDLVHGRRGVLARESVVQDADLFVAAEIAEIEGRDKALNTLLSLVTRVERDWLEQMYPGDLRERIHAEFDPAKKRVTASRQILFRDLVIEDKPLEPPPAEQAAAILAEEVRQGRLHLRGWDHDAEQFVIRLNRLAAWCPDLGLPAMTEADRLALLEQVCHGATSYKDIKDRPVKPVLEDWLNPAQKHALDKHAPERIEVPGAKRRAKVTYAAEGDPYIALRIQELFDLRETPRIAMGRVPLLLHILAPNQRPVQVTHDLPGFWRDHYPRIKQELQRKYPRHEWR